jgi:hypothetical protein
LRFKMQPSRSKAARSSSEISETNLSRRHATSLSASRSRATCNPARLSLGLPITGLSRNDFAPVASAATCSGARSQES